MNQNPNDLCERAAALRLHGILAHWSQIASADWLSGFIGWEEDARAQRSLERRIGAARIGRFKALADFDWSWPKRLERGAIEGLMTLEFIKEAANVVLLGPNGVGKSTLARNVAHQVLVQGHTVRFTTAGQLLGELAAACDNVDEAGEVVTLVQYRDQTHARQTQGRIGSHRSRARLGRLLPGFGGLACKLVWRGA